MIPRILILLAASLLASCGGTGGNPDTYAAKGDYDRAIELYEEQISESDDPAEISDLKVKLARIKDEASQSYGQEATNRLRTKQYDMAYEAVQKAYRYDPSATNADLLAQIKTEYARYLYQEGKAKLDAGFLDEAILSIEKAHKLDPNPEYTTLLQDLRARMRDEGKEQFPKLIKRANSYFDQRKWDDAVTAFGAALRIQSDVEAQDKREFSRLLIEAEDNLTTDKDKARSALMKAKELGYHRSYVTALLKKVN